MNESIWQKYSDQTNFTQLQKNLHVDVAIIGGGISGVTTAALLSTSGMKVAVFEKNKIGQSSTGNSTGNLYIGPPEILLDVREKFNKNITEKILHSRSEAIDFVINNIMANHIDCDFKKTNLHYFSKCEKFKYKIDKVFANARELNQIVHYDGPHSIAITGAAQLNPLRYVQGFAKAISAPNCSIYENTAIEEISEEKDYIKLKSDNGYDVTANWLIHATHTPKGIARFHVQLGPYREYGIAGKIKRPYRPGIFFGHYDESGNIISTRAYERMGEQFLIAVGKPHKVGQSNGNDEKQGMIDFLKNHFELEHITHEWSAQNYRSADGLPYIGPTKRGSNIFVVTGLSTHGLTYGTVAAQIISDLILKGKNTYSKIYSPNRLALVKSAKNIIKENVNAASFLIKDCVFPKKDVSFFDIDLGSGEVIKQSTHLLAVYRENEESFKICSAVCSHMGCVVHWNNVEKSWDCPCHGSRFDTEGKVIEGPALKGLDSYEKVMDRPAHEESNESLSQ